MAKTDASCTSFDTCEIFKVSFYLFIFLPKRPTSLPLSSPFPGRRRRIRWKTASESKNNAHHMVWLGTPTFFNAINITAPLRLSLSLCLSHFYFFFACIIPDEPHNNWLGTRANWQGWKGHFMRAFFSLLQPWTRSVFHDRPSTPPNPKGPSRNRTQLFCPPKQTKETIFKNTWFHVYSRVTCDAI